MRPAISFGTRGRNDTPARRYKTDPFLAPDETLEEVSDHGDYAGAYAAVGYDRGHLVPLASFRESPFVQEVNYLSVLAPQVAGLNRGPWRSIELAVRGLAAELGQVYVIAGPVYDSSTMRWKRRWRRPLHWTGISAGRATSRLHTVRQGYELASLYPND